MSEGQVAAQRDGSDRTRRQGKGLHASSLPQLEHSSPAFSLTGPVGSASGIYACRLLLGVPLELRVTPFVPLVVRLWTLFNRVLHLWLTEGLSQAFSASRLT